MSAVFNEPQVFIQPETGEKFTLIVNGDEFGATFTTLDGYAIKFNSTSNCWVYCDRTTRGKLTLTKTPAHIAAPKHLLRGLCDLSDETIQRRNNRVNQRYFQPLIQPGMQGTNFTLGSQNGLLPGRIVRGDVSGLVVIVEFEDIRAFDDAITLVNGLYNGSNPHLNNSTTVQGYFETISNGKFNFRNIVHPVVVRLPQNRSFYMRNSIVPAVMDVIKDDLTFADYDSRNEGVVDSLTFLYAGDTQYGDPDSGTAELWPHNSIHATQKFENGRQYRTHFYMLTSLGSSPASMTIGTSCHELCHLTLRCPDLYDYGVRDSGGIGIGEGDSDGIGPYCLMGNGNHVESGQSPVPMCAYLRDLSDFIDNEVLLNDVAGEHEIYASDYSTIFKHVVSANESFIVENHSAVGLRSGMANYRKRTTTGVVTENISGLAIMHCDTEGSNEWQQNTSQYHYQTYLLQADGRSDLELNQGADEGDLFANIDGIAVSFDTSPSTRRWDGADSGLTIRDISPPGEKMTFVTGSDPA